jgi:hypothetical protein
MAGEDLLEGSDGGSNDTDAKSKGKKKPLSKGQKIGVIIGGVTILLVIVQIERSKASASTAATTSTTAPIDPTTGYPSGSPEDQAALANMGSSGGGGSGYSSGYGSSTDPSVDPSTGASYSSEIGANTTALSTLGTDFTALENQFSTLQGEVVPPPSQTPPPSSTPPPAHGATALQSANLANLEAELKRDSTGKKTPTKTAAIKRLNTQITAVKARS